MLHQLHRFREAEAVARTLVTKRDFVLDYALLGDALMEQGRLTEAAAAYQKMIDLKPFYQSYTRAAHLRWLTGDLDGAIDLEHKAIATASPRNPESVAWAYTRLGIYELQQARFDRAIKATDAALAFQPDYAAALLTRGRILLALNRSDEAVRALERAMPTHAHGQGYSDLNFLIPELVSGVQYSKGPYFADRRLLIAISIVSSESRY